MLICGIFRNINGYDGFVGKLSLTLPFGIGFIDVTLAFKDQSEVWEFSLDPKESIEASVPFCYFERRLS
jgi:hypothetical protein